MRVDPDSASPRSVDAERGVLAGVMTDPEIAVEVFGLLTPDDFHDARHSYVYRACMSLDSRNRYIDLVTVAEELERQKWLELSGGIEYLTGLADDIPILASVRQYAEIVREKSMLRRLGSASRETIREIAEGTLIPAEIIDRAEKRVFDIAEKTADQDFLSMEELVGMGMREFERVSQSDTHITGLSTGFDRLDWMTTGLHGGELVIIAARPSVGKTTLAINMALNIARQSSDVDRQSADIARPRGGAVCFFSLEMAGRELIKRILSSESKVGMEAWKGGDMSSQAMLDFTNACDRLASLPMFVNERAGITSLELRASARRLRKRFGLSAVFVDYLQLMRGVGGEENRQQEIARISGDLKALAKDLDVPVIALSQLSRRAVSHEGPARLPRLSDLRESGAIEQDADLVLFLHEDGGEEAYADRSYPRDRSIKLVIGKQRNGPRGEIDLVFQTELGRFLEMARD